VRGRASDTQTQARNAHSGQQPTIVCVSRLIDKPKDLPAIIMIVGSFRIARLYRNCRWVAGRSAVNYSGTPVRQTDGYLSRLSDHIESLLRRPCRSGMREEERERERVHSTSLSGPTDEQKNNPREENKELYAPTCARTHLRTRDVFLLLARSCARAPSRATSCTLAPVNRGVESR